MRCLIQPGRIMGTGCVMLMLLAVGCSQAPGVRDPGTLAQVGDSIITVEDLRQRLAERSRRSSGLPLTKADRDAALEELVQFEALYVRARQTGLHTNQALVAAFKRTVVSRFKEQGLAGLNVATPSDVEIEGYYQRHLERFTTPAKIRGAIIRLDVPRKATAERRSQAFTEATALREQAIQETAHLSHFGELAERHSTDQATRYVQGDFGWLTPAALAGRHGAALAEAVAALVSAGEVTPVVETPDGLAFVKLTERQPESRRPLAQVRDGIVRQLKQTRHAQAEDDFLAVARRQVAVRIDRELLDSVSLPDRRVEPPSVPGLQTTQAKTPHEDSISN
ncbi:MAG: peptidyl-prolyl cis-trans isomerase [Verrucomicrobiales bacterium]|nr:peptidyl-prolyl cis-trans isomerase [Verrucomicrobiales bacterium]